MTATAATEASCKKGEQVLKEFLDSLDRDLVGDAKIYAQKQWIERGEAYGTTGSAILTFDGSWLYDVFNSADCGKCAQVVMDKFTTLLKNNELGYEMGCAWYLYVYEDR